LLELEGMLNRTPRGSGIGNGIEAVDITTFGFGNMRGLAQLLLKGASGWCRSRQRRCSESGFGIEWGLRVKGPAR